MGKLVVSREGVIVKEVLINKSRTTLGRRPYNDIVIDNLAVSGEHAVFELVDQELYIQDLKSTNGTYLNGEAVKRQRVLHGDTVALGKYAVQYLDEALAASTSQHAKTTVLTPDTVARLAATTHLGSMVSSTKPALLKPLNDPKAPPVLLTKVVTTVGKMGLQVASITKRPAGLVLSHVDGPSRPIVNGVEMAQGSATLKNGDIIDLAGQRWQFVQE